ncbi:MAG: metallophosphoesterase [Gemmataceae bacterium]|nr:metallophosphoesterase [Gemmataceae bacterium]MDW8266459.1 metallophosphoesterase [Gemmataceae bacterium]
MTRPIGMPEASLIGPLAGFVAFWLGHVAILTFSLNRWYARPYSRLLLRWVRRGHAFLVVAGPAAAWWFGGLDLWAALEATPNGAAYVLGAMYLIVCWLAGLMILPGLTIGRLVQRPPSALLSNHTRTIDVSAELGFAPSGSGAYRWLTRLPGNDVFRVDFCERTLRLPRLPAAWDGLTILHVSDLHFAGTPDRHFFGYVFDRCRDWGEPDLLAITGDIVDSDQHDRWIVPLVGRLRWRVGAWAILGNHDREHDPQRIRRRLHRAGISVLGNRWERRLLRGEPLTVIGHEGPWFTPGPRLDDCPADGFRLCLSHTPDNLPWARRHGIDLMLAGHNHGGQIRLPVIGAIFVPSRYGRRYDCGTFDEPPTLLHVSRGLSGQQPVRFRCRPEVTWLVLRATRQAGNLEGRSV